MEILDGNKNRQDKCLGGEELGGLIQYTGVLTNPVSDKLVFFNRGEKASTHLKAFQEYDKQ